MMRRQGSYADSGFNSYAAAQNQMHQMSGQRMDDNSGHNFEGRLEAFTPERDDSYVTSKAEGKWRWESDGSKISTTSHMLNEGQGDEATRSYFQDQRPDPKQSGAQPCVKDMDVGFENNLLSQTLEGLEQKFREDIMKLVKDQNDAEDAENARHKEKISAINTQYEEQLAALRVRQVSRRDEFLRKELNAREQQYEKIMVNHYSKSTIGPNDPQGYSGIAASANVSDAYRGYDTERYDSYQERARFLGGNRDQRFEPRGPYSGGRVYDTGSRYY